MGIEDAAIRSLVCDACWGGIFSAEGWQTVLAAKQVPGRLGFSKGYSYQTSFAALRAAAEGCAWCCFLARPHPNREGDVEVWAACDQDSACTPAGEKNLTIALQGSNNSGLVSLSHYHMYTRSDDQAARYVRARDRITNISTPESYKLALDCLQNCLQTRDKCPEPQPAITLLPDRVIDCSNTKQPKIVLTGGKQHGLYVALSYVWGGPQPMATTKNIDKYASEGLVMKEFPQTIQDAVVVTQNLGQRYLWIDALCILQDSVEDKTRQLGMMHRIYRDAYLTLNAACAKSTREGFLHRQRPAKIPDARIPYPCPDGTVGSIWIAREHDTDATDASRSYWDELEPVTHRAWCFQERLLPARSLIYASDTLKYACQTETVNIGGALCEPSTGLTLPNALYRRSRPLSSEPLSEEETEDDRAASRQAWLATLFRYTLRDITVASDKLVALAGLVEQFQLAYKDQYLAGLWRQTLLLDLLWKNSAFDGLHPRPAAYRAPSWSWASTDGLIIAQYLEQSLIAPDNLSIRKAVVLDCRVELASKMAPLGEVTDGVLKLKAIVKEVTVEQSAGTWGDVQYRDVNGKMVKVGVTSFDADEERSAIMFVIPILWDILGSFVMGIVVTKTARDRYQRVGRFENSHGSKEVKWLEGLDEQEILLV